MKNIGAFILFMICFNGCKQAPTEPPITAEAKKINSYLNEIIEKQKIPGLALAVTRNDSVVYTGAFGFRNIETQEPMKLNYVFHWASVAKTFVATAIMQLVEKGKIDLDEKLITYLPYFKQQDENYKNITIKQMLNHTSGIGNVEDYEWDKPQNDDEAPKRYVKGLENDKMLFEPGKDWAYSNTAFNTLGVVISEVSGMSFETYIKENIFKPLEMKHSSFIYPEIPESLRVKGHIADTITTVSEIYPYNKIHAPSSTLNSNVIDMTHYAMANLNRGKYKNTQILSDSSYDLLWTNSVNMERKPRIGMSWFLSEFKGMKIVFHRGADVGFRSFLILVPEKNISVMFTYNSTLNFTRNIVGSMLNIVLGEKSEKQE